MNKSVLPAALLLVGLVLPGCPLYDHEDDGCYYDSDCAAGYLCDDRDGSCYPEDSDACRKPSDCGANETCSRSGTCKTGDCHYASVGCVRGYECSSESGIWECVRSGGSSSGGAPNEGGTGGTEAVAGAPSAGTPSDGGAPSAAGAPSEGGAAGNTGSAGSP